MPLKHHLHNQHQPQRRLQKHLFPRNIYHRAQQPYRRVDHQLRIRYIIPNRQRQLKHIRLNQQKSLLIRYIKALFITLQRANFRQLLV